MKYFLIFAIIHLTNLAIAQNNLAIAQNNLEPTDFQLILNNIQTITLTKKIEVMSFLVEPVTKLTIKGNEKNPRKLYVILAAENEKLDSLVSNDSTNILLPSSASEFSNIKFSIVDSTNSNNKISFIIMSETTNNPPDGIKDDITANNKLIRSISADDYLRAAYGRDMQFNRYGITLKDNNSQQKARGNNHVHIFLDQNGNTLFSTIPAGIANMNYMVHIAYITYADNSDKITYEIRETSGGFDPTLVLNNNENKENPGEIQNEVALTWTEKTISLSTSTSDLSFELYKIVKESVETTAIKTKLVSYTIKMSPVYNGTIEVGLFNTELKSPEFTLETQQDNSDLKTVKRDYNGRRGVVSGMATLYTSPIILLRKYLLGHDIPNFMLTGRSILYDHAWYERIYPSVGLGISDEVFKNIFFGFSWEIARGASIYAGGHYSNVNTFYKEGFEFGETTITKSEFDLLKKNSWELDWSYGINLDFLIITSLFRR